MHRVQSSSDLHGCQRARGRARPRLFPCTQHRNAQRPPVHAFQAQPPTAPPAAPGAARCPGGPRAWQPARPCGRFPPPPQAAPQWRPLIAALEHRRHLPRRLAGAQNLCLRGCRPPGPAERPPPAARHPSQPRLTWQHPCRHRFGALRERGRRCQRRQSGPALRHGPGAPLLLGCFRAGPGRAQPEGKRGHPAGWAVRSQGARAGARAARELLCRQAGILDLSGATASGRQVGIRHAVPEGGDR